jgi:hypothetical protein
MKEIQTEKWYVILGSTCGIISVHSSRAEANAEHKKQKYTKKNRIIKCKISYD